jgi:hypothetical protein
MTFLYSVLLGNTFVIISLIKTNVCGCFRQGFDLVSQKQTLDSGVS